MNILSINELREAKKAQGTELHELKSDIKKLNEYEKSLRFEILSKKQQIQKDTADIEVLKMFFNNKKVNFLKEDNMSYENAVVYENKTIEKELEKLNKLKAEKQALYQLVENEIEKQRLKMDKELIEAKLNLHNEKADLLNREKDLKCLLTNCFYQNNDEKLVIESEINENSRDQQILDKKIEELKLRETDCRTAILNEYNGLDELKSHDMTEIKNEEERFYFLTENSLSNLDTAIRKKTSQYDEKKDELKRLYDLLNDSSVRLNEVLSKVRRYLLSIRR
jgi:hypothetical protein